MHRLRQRLVGQVDHELSRTLDVNKRILDPAVGPPVDGEHAERRILAEHVEEAERRGLTTPADPSVVTHAIGRGRTNEVSTL